LEKGVTCDWGRCRGALLLVFESDWASAKWARE